MSDAAIQRLLADKVYPPARARLALVRLGPPHGGDLPGTARAEQNASDVLLTVLRKSGRLSDAVVLPPMLTPQQLTVPSLREAAARLQADLILAYRTTRRTAPPSPLPAVSPDPADDAQARRAPSETRGTYTVEAVLFDTRTGVALDTAVATESYAAAYAVPAATPARSDGASAEGDAIDLALGRVGREISNYLDTAPLPPGPAGAPAPANRP